MTSLSPDLELEILSWLSARDAVRAQLVCKAWAALLRGDSRFKALWRKHGRNTAKTLLLLHHGVNRKTSRLQTRYHYRGPFVSIFKHKGKVTRLKHVPPGWKQWLAPQNSQPLVSHGGLVLCRFMERKTFMNKQGFLVGNPLTQQWVSVPGVQANICSCMLTTYASDEGVVFFRIWLNSYVFDSRLGVWTVPQYQTVSMLSSNTVCVGGVCYRLGECWQHGALVLLEIDDMAAINSAKWVHAWCMKEVGIYKSYMLEVGGEIGVLVEVASGGLRVLVLDRGNWTWNEVSSFLIRKQAYLLGECCTVGSLTFAVWGRGILMFDSQSLKWDWLEKRSKAEIIMQKLLSVELDFTAVANINTPSEKMKQVCASRYRNAFFARGMTRCFSGLKALSGSGLSWPEIGKVAAEQSKGVRLSEKNETVDWSRSLQF
ncbi:hypothetical protein SELMODRAFT_417415 [Selaginella moellendorffii]|uniref:F-box domain-containing protein n=1 Tax=Selaginella moellendorffii TaxID=88036 RepID=D8S252_SELML|nr:hypothetical protein SELMODRAFT_417415 [Selaginella moellendorffii]